MRDGVLSHFIYLDSDEICNLLFSIFYFYRLMLYNHANTNPIAIVI